MTVTVVLPAFNEETRIVDTLQAVKGLSLVDEIIVVNDWLYGPDGEQASQIGVTLIDLPINRGKEAMNAALPYINSDIVVFWMLIWGHLRLRRLRLFRWSRTVV